MTGTTAVDADKARRLREVMTGKLTLGIFSVRYSLSNFWPSFWARLTGCVSDVA